MDNRETDRARDKKRRRQISLEEKQKNVIAAIREKEEMLAATKMKMSGIQHFLHKKCNWEVPGSFTLYSFKTVAKKCTKKACKVVFC